MKLFAELVDAADLAGLSPKQFRRASKLLGLRRIEIKRKFFFVRAEIEEKRAELIALTGQEGHAQQKGPRVKKG